MGRMEDRSENVQPNGELHVSHPEDIRHNDSSANNNISLASPKGNSIGPAKIHKMDRERIVIMFDLIPIRKNGELQDLVQFTIVW